MQVADPERARGRRGHQDIEHARQVVQPQRRLEGAQGSGKTINRWDPGSSVRERLELIQ